MQEATKKRTPSRGDIQGLRALAVVAVVADHAFAWPTGGFVGVDVFFVISGFLITGLLLREHDRTGRISFADFYRRRVRRIMPSAVLVLLVTVIGSWALLGHERISGVIEDAIAAFLFSANWRFAIAGTDYFQASGPTSPLQHFWSLSVEEQFYFVWPVVLLIALALAKRRGALARGGRRWAGLAIGAIGLCSFAWAVYETSASSTVAYFSTFSRAWELALGAALALLSPWFEKHLADGLRPVLAWTGLVVIVVSFFTTSSTVLFPAPGAAVAVGGAALVILAGTGGDGRYLFPLTNPVSRYLGDTSYSLYLWHFPVIIVFGPFLLYKLGIHSPNVLYYVVLLVTAATLAFAAYHLVEVPIRRSRWLLPSQHSARQNYARKQRRPYAYAGGAALATLVLVGGALGYSSFGSHVVPASSSAGSAPAKAQAQAGSGATKTTAQTELTAKIEEALKATSWPTTTNGPEDPPGNSDICGSAKLIPAARCTFGDPNAPHKALLVGDSIAQAWVPALITFLGTGDWSLQIRSLYACPFIDAAVGATSGQVSACTTRKADEYAAIQSTKPDLLIISSTFIRAPDPTTGLPATQDLWNTSFASMISKIKGNATKFVLLPPPPADKDTATCKTPYSKPADCITRVAATSWLTMANAQKPVVEAAGGVFLDNREWFCDADGQCPSFVNNILVKKDKAHPSQTYTEYLAGIMADAFNAAKLLQPDAEPAASSGSASG